MAGGCLVGWLAGWLVAWLQIVSGGLRGVLRGVVWLVAIKLAGLDLFFVCCFHLVAFSGLFCGGARWLQTTSTKRQHGAVVWLLWLLCWRGCWLAGRGFVLCSLRIATGASAAAGGADPF